MPDQLLVLQASSQGGDWMSVTGRPVSQSPHQPPFPPGTSPSHYALHQASPAAQTATPHAVTSPYHSNQSYLPQSQVDCLSSCPSPCCQLKPCVMFPRAQNLCASVMIQDGINLIQGNHWKSAGTLANTCGLQLFQSLLNRPAHIWC